MIYLPAIKELASKRDWTELETRVGRGNNVRATCCGDPSKRWTEKRSLIPALEV